MKLGSTRTDVVVYPLPSTFGRVSFIDTSNDQVYEALPDIRNKAVDIILRAETFDAIGFGEFPIPSIVGQQQHLRRIGGGLAQVLGVELQAQANR